MSALFFGGLPAKIFQGVGDQFTLLISSELLEEIAEVLERPKFVRSAKLTLNDRRRFVRRLAEIGQFVPWLEPVPQFDLDPKDTHLLACAKTRLAEYLVTGDQALLSLKRYHQTKIVTPRHFFDLLKRS